MSCKITSVSQVQLLDIYNKRVLSRAQAILAHSDHLTSIWSSLWDYSCKKDSDAPNLVTVGVL